VKWLTRLRGREEIALPTTVAFDEELDAWLTQVSKSLFGDLSANAEQGYTAIRESRDRLRQRVAELGDADSTEQVPDRIVKIGLTSRKKMVTHLQGVTEKITLPTRTDYHTIVAFHRDTVAALEFPFGKSQTNIYCVRSLFPNEIKEIISELNQLRSGLDQLIAPLQGKEQQLRALERVPELAASIKELRAELVQKREQLMHHENELTALNQRIQDERKRQQTLEAGEEWHRFTALERERSALEAELGELESNVQKLFAPLSKPLTLLMKQDESGRFTLAQADRHAISSLLESPSQALEGDIVGSLSSIKGLIEDDPTVLKDRKRENALSWLNKLLKADLESIAEKRRSLVSQILDVDASCANAAIRQEKEVRERALLVAQEQLTQAQEERERATKRIASLEADLVKAKQFLGAVLTELAGKEIELVLEVP
jgi:predicted  nucleic acid-binding Zn-ribbon protein